MENNKEKIALFDFCETLANFQTADEYVRFTRQYYRYLSIRSRFALYKVLLKIKFVNYLTRIFPQGSINKKIVLWQLRWLKKDKLEESARMYYTERICPNLILDMVQLLRKLQNEGWRIILVSGGYEIYLKYFAADNGIPENDVLACRFSYIGDLFLGRMKGGDCLWDEKVRRLEEVFDRKKCIVKAFSDSESDLPMLRWADEAYVISRNIHQEWVDKYNFKEIIWKE